MNRELAQFASSVDAVLLDLDNTLVDRQAAMQRYLDQFLQRVEPSLTAEEQLRWVDEFMRVDDFGYCSREAWSKAVCEMLRSEFDIAKSSSDFLAEFLSDFANHFRPDESVCELVRRMASQFRVAIVTNGTVKNQSSKICNAGLEGLVEHVFISEEHRSWKPDPQLFQIAMKALGVTPEQTLMVGDDLVRDIEPTQRLGVAACWVSMGRENQTEIVPDFCVNTFCELDSVLNLP